MTKRPELGQWCTVKQTCRKWRLPDSNMYRWGPANKANMRMVFVGWRIVHDVNTDWEHEFDEFGRDYGGWWNIKHKASYEVWLFAWDARRKHVFAFPSDVEFESE